MTALEAGLATLPAAAVMIAITPFITPLAVKIGTRQAVGIGFALAAVGFAVLAFVGSAWEYVAFVLPLVAISAGLGLSNGPASSASTSAVPDDQVGQASGISNMARYVGGVAVRRRRRDDLHNGDRRPTPRPGRRRRTRSPPGSGARHPC